MKSTVRVAMSITSISSSYNQLSTYPTARSNAVSSAPTTPVQGSSGSTGESLNPDLHQLLKSLANNITADARKDLDALSKDVTADKASGASDDQLNKVLNKLADSLSSSSDTGGALNLLAGYLVENGKSSGNLLNVTA